MRVPASQVYKVMPVKGVTFRKQVKVRQPPLQSVDIQAIAVAIANAFAAGSTCIDDSILLDRLRSGPLTADQRLQGGSKERMLCLTAKRRGRTQGFRGMLHACKPAPGGRFQVGT